MNGNALKGLIISKGTNVENFLFSLKGRGVNMSKNSFYRKIKEETQFDRLEIVAIAAELCMSDETILKIFFNEIVS